MSKETRVTDPKTGGQKGSKVEDYSQIPPIPLSEVLDLYKKTQAKKAANEAAIVNEIKDLLTSYVTKGKEEYLIEAAYKALEEMGFWDGLDSVARVYYYGSLKYSPGNWCKGYSWRLSVSSAYRHLLKAKGGEVINKEIHDGTLISEEPHLAHFIWHCFTLYEFKRKGLGTDDLLFLEDRYGKAKEEVK